MDKKKLDNLRRRMQDALIASKRDQLREEFDAEPSRMDGVLSPEEEIQWLTLLLELERQSVDEEPLPTVRDRVGALAFVPFEEIAPYRLAEAVEEVIALLYDQGISVEFFGEWDDEAVYRYLTEKLLDEEMDEIQFEEMIAHFDVMTPEYEVTMWVQIFVNELFSKTMDHSVTLSKDEPLLDRAGQPLSPEELKEKVAAIKKQLPENARLDIAPFTITVGDNEGEVSAVLKWIADDGVRQTTSFFRLKPSLYSAWYVVQTSMLDDLLNLLF